MRYAPDEPLEPREATQAINEIARFPDAEIRLTGHCEERMLKRGIDFQDLLLMLSNGVVSDSPEFDVKRGHYKYRIEGPTIDDDDATAVLVVLTRRSVLVITVF